MKNVKPYLIAAAAGGVAYAAGQAFWNRRSALEKGGGGDGYAEKPIWSQLWEAMPDLPRLATVGIAAGLVGYVAARKLG